MYLSEEKNLKYIMDATELSLDEIETIVGRFKKDHYRFAGKLKGEYVEKLDGTKMIVHHFTKKVLWRDE